MVTVESCCSLIYAVQRPQVALEKPVLRAINDALHGRGLAPADRVTKGGLKALLDGTTAADGSAWRAGTKNRQTLLAEAWCEISKISKTFQNTKLTPYMRMSNWSIFFLEMSLCKPQGQLRRWMSACPDSTLNEDPDGCV